jgi:hypothetical protein
MHEGITNQPIRKPEPKNGRRALDSERDKIRHNGEAEKKATAMILEHHQ